MESLLSKEVIFSFPIFRVKNLSPIDSGRWKKKEIHSKSKRSLLENKGKKRDKYFSEEKNFSSRKVFS